MLSSSIPLFVVHKFNVLPHESPPNLSALQNRALCTPPKIVRSSIVCSIELPPV